MDLGHLPHSPGVYLMRDAAARIVYIGKAKDLRKRVASYFQSRVFEPKIAAMTSVVRHIDYIPTASERECLLLEQRLIRKIQPVYNTMWRDDKSYPWVKVTFNEDYPRLIITRRKKRDGGMYFGPYPNVGTIKYFLRSLWKSKFLALRPCRYEFRRENVEAPGGLEKSNPAQYRKIKSCIYLHTGECPAPCVGKISGADYLDIAKKAERLFSGSYKSLEGELRLAMSKASSAMRYEKAAEIRNQLEALFHMNEKVTFREVSPEAVTEQTLTSRGLTELQEKLKLPAPPLRIECFDISNIQSTEPVASMVVFERGTPKKSDYRKYKIKTVQGPNDFAMIKETVKRRYGRVYREEKGWPGLILIDGGKGQLSNAVAALKELAKEQDDAIFTKLPIASLAKENEEIYLPDSPDPIVLPKDSPGLHIVQHIRDEAHRFAITFHRQRRDKSAFRGASR